MRDFDWGTIFAMAVFGAVISILIDLWRRFVWKEPPDHEEKTNQVSKGQEHPSSSKVSPLNADETIAVPIVAEKDEPLKLAAEVSEASPRGYRTYRSNYAIGGVLTILVGIAFGAWINDEAPAVSWALVLSGIWSAGVWLWPRPLAIKSRVASVWKRIAPLFYGLCFFAGGALSYSGWVEAREAFLKSSGTWEVPLDDLHSVVTKFDQWSDSLNPTDHARLVSSIEEAGTSDPKASVVLFIVANRFIEPQDRRGDAYGTKLREIRKQICERLDISLTASSTEIVEALAKAMTEDGRDFFTRRLGLVPVEIGM